MRVFQRVREEIPAVLVLVGDGPDRPETESVVEQFGLQEHVRFLGQLKVVVDILQAADLFLLPSTSESFGLGALEAMACGIPVVASNVGGLPEVVVHGESGMLHDPDDLDGMAARAVALLGDDQRWRAASEAAVTRAAGFSSDGIVPQYDALYR